MKKLDVSGVTNSAQMKLKSGTLQFLQDANAEAFTALCLALIGTVYNASQVYILYGCINSGSGNNYNISAGAVFFAGEIYLVDAASFVLNANIAIFSPITTQYEVNADPMTFSDSSVNNIHNIRQMRIIAGASGSMNYADAAGILSFIPAQLNIKGKGAATIEGAYPNLFVNVPNQTNNYPALYAGTLDIGDFSGTQDFAVSFPAALPTASYYIAGTLVSNPTSTDPASDTTVVWTIRGRTAGGFVLRVRELGNYTQDISFEFIIFAV